MPYHILPVLVSSVLQNRLVVRKLISYRERLHFTQGVTLRARETETNNNLDLEVSDVTKRVDIH